LKHSSGFVAISSAVEQEYLAHGVDPSAIERIPNGIDTKRFSPVNASARESIRDRLRIPQSARVVVFTGRLVQYKGLPLLLRVWKEIQHRHPDAQLLLVGSGGLDIDNCEDALKSDVTSNGLERTVRFTGAVENVHEYLQASDVFVFPTENEAFGISLVEAMACGLPAIATPVGGVDEILAGGRYGLIVELGSYDQLLEALNFTLTNHALATELGQKGRRAVEECYAIEVVLKRYIQRFERARVSRSQ
jgi:glycosyltransferase involved in cell wall biosynthesis